MMTYHSPFMGNSIVHHNFVSTRLHIKGLLPYTFSITVRCPRGRYSPLGSLEPSVLVLVFSYFDLFGLWAFGGSRRGFCQFRHHACLGSPSGGPPHFHES
jgi:hypothetical protein